MTALFLSAANLRATAKSWIDVVTRGLFAGCFVACASTAAWASGKTLDHVGLTVGDIGNPFFVQIAKGVEAKAKHINSSVKVTALSSNYDAVKQADQIDQFISSGVNLIVLGAADSKAIAPAVSRAKKAGVVVIAVDVGAEGGVDATVTSDNKDAGRKDAEYIASRLKGTGEIAILNGPNVTAVTDRIDGFTEQMKKYPGITVLARKETDGSRDAGQRVTRELLAEFPKIDAVFAINDPVAIGCDLAAKEAGRKDFFIVGVDGAPEVVPYLKNPDSLIAATAAQNPFVMAGQAVEVGYDVLQGKDLAEKLSLTPVGLITKANVNRYAGWARAFE